MLVNSFSKRTIPEGVVDKALEYKSKLMEIYNEVDSTSDYDTFVYELKSKLKSIGHDGSSKLVVELDDQWVIKIPLIMTDEPAKEVKIISEFGEITDMYPPSKHLGDYWLLQKKVKTLDGTVYFSPEEITSLVNRLVDAGVDVTDLVFTEPYRNYQKLYYSDIRYEQFGVLDGKLVCIDFGYVE